MGKLNNRIIRVEPYGLERPAFWALLASAVLCTAVFVTMLLFTEEFPQSPAEPINVYAGVSIFCAMMCVMLWPCFLYYGLYLPKLSITLNLASGEFTLVTPRKRVIAPITDFCYTVTSPFTARQSSLYIHIFHQGKRLIRINTDDWRNIRVLLDLPHKPDPKIDHLRRLH